jgi:hypothetical protein
MGEWREGSAGLLVWNGNSEVEDRGTGWVECRAVQGYWYGMVTVR